MSATPIVALQPNVTQADAMRAFSKQGLSSLYWRMTAGSLQRIAVAYVPYQFYEVRFVMTRAPQTRLFAMDAVDGSLDLFEFPATAVLPAFVDGRIRATGSRPSCRERRPMTCCGKKRCAPFFSTAFLKCASKASSFRVNRTWCTCLTGWVFMRPEKSCVAG